MDVPQSPEDFQLLHWPPTSNTNPRATFYSMRSIAAPGRTLFHLFTQAGEHIEGALAAIPGTCFPCRTGAEPTNATARWEIHHQAPGISRPEETSISQAGSDSGHTGSTSFVTFEDIPEDISEEEDLKSRGVSASSNVTSIAFFWDEHGMLFRESLEGDQPGPWYRPDARTVLNLIPPPRRSPRRDVKRLPYNPQELPMIVFSPASPCKPDFPRESWVDPPPYSLHPPRPQPETDSLLYHARRRKGLRRNMMPSMSTIRNRVCCAV
ncbi:hypothetical protein BOTBODRAFT_41174 [Botryobasidium botryosum FD-172 SS1]|uniref:Uncharacterized protein n=1 Tax=Botryobasidium botryosum (strain FD-172 SS1) TaxID=930990 RepID=A0A067MWA1_BOTB1|nr:hypothetical protein BOTBODRAFT_41174 [Botryobasidium botryosum FD-172 SS1]